MKATTTEFRTHLDGTVTNLASLWRLTRTDGQNFYFTDHDVDIPFDDGDGVQTYLAASGYDRSAISNTATLAVDNVDLEGFFNIGGITENDLVAGRFDSAVVQISTVNWSDLTQGRIREKKGKLGEVLPTRIGIYRVEFRGLTQSLSQNIIETYGSECLADLGDSKCKIPIRPNVLPRSTAVVAGDFYRVNTAGGNFQDAFENRVYEVTTAGTTAASQPAYNTTIDATTTDGTAVLTARDSFTRHATIASVVNDFTVTITVNESRAVDDWFNGGALIFEEGLNVGIVREIVDWVQSTNTITLFLKLPFTPVINERVRLYPGCDKRSTTCINRFANIINFRGFDFIPGNDLTTG